MRSRKYTVTVVGDKGAAAVSAWASLDLAYKDLFDAALAEVQGTGPTVDAGVRLIVFGCFWLEALCNEKLRRLLQTLVQPETVGMALWEVSERAPFLSKFSIVSAFAKHPDSDQVKRLVSEMKQLFDLRNRLAHFKESTPVLGTFPLDERFGDRLNQLPEPELIKQLKPPLLLSYSKAIVCGIDWLSKF